jgi:acyl-CoA reductase-like NAD-dependent aldehyde dehydrogenase
MGRRLVIAPWNYPYMTAINTIVPALIAGNAVILKHATPDPAWSASGWPRLPRGRRARGGVPERRLDHDTTAELIAGRHSTSSTSPARSAAGRRSNAPPRAPSPGSGWSLAARIRAMSCPDADLDAAVDTLMDGAMFNAGQCCCGIERIYVATRASTTPFVEKAVAWAEGLQARQPARRARPRWARWRRSASPRGARPDRRGRGRRRHGPCRDLPADDDGGTYLTPQVLTGVTHDMRVMRDESFGPVVGIMPSRTTTRRSA